MFEPDFVYPQRWEPAIGGGIGLSLWRAAPPTPARIRWMTESDPGNDCDRIERIGAWEQIIAWAQAQQCAEMAAFVDDNAAAAAARPHGMTAADAVASAEAEIALALHTTTRAASGRCDDARDLRHRYPATQAALATGRITLAQARVILDGGTDLDDAGCAALEQHVLARAARQTVGQLRAAVRRAVLRIDPRAAQRRHERKRRDRKVVLYPERDGMATLSATLPAVEALGIWAVLDQHARACHHEPADPDGQRRSMDARRADTLVDLVLGETGFASRGSTNTHPDHNSPGPGDDDDGDTGNDDTDNDGTAPATTVNGDAGPETADPANARLDGVVDLSRGDTTRGGSITHGDTTHGDITHGDINHGDTTQDAAHDDGDGDGAEGHAVADTAAAAVVMPADNRDRMAWARWLTSRYRARQAAADESAPPPPTSDPTNPPGPDPDRLPGVAPPSQRGATTRVQVQIRVTVPLDVLTGASDMPAELAGYGPLPAAVAREWAADPTSTWQRLITDPATGALLEHGTTRYRPPTALREHVYARHQTCQFPGCRTPAHRCDLDHNIPFDPTADTGPTDAANLGPKCRPHHRIKGLPGWEVTQYPDGTIVWRTPSGHSYTAEPPPLDPAAPAPLSRVEPVNDDTPPPF